MQLNVGTADRIIRITIGIVCAYFALAPTDVLANEVLRIVIGVFAILNLGTGLLGWCPMYAMASLNTRKE
jgi:hypothetical protein